MTKAIHACVVVAKLMLLLAPLSALQGEWIWTKEIRVNWIFFFFFFFFSFSFLFFFFSLLTNVDLTYIQG